MLAAKPHDLEGKWTHNDRLNLNSDFDQPRLRTTVENRSEEEAWKGDDGICDCSGEVGLTARIDLGDVIAF